MPRNFNGAACAPGPLVAPQRSGRALRSIFVRLAEWRERSLQRTQLASMNERMLKDVGISHGEAVHEASKPFWRD